ncbi:MAG: Stealth CR1 domain-containing protein [Mycoplasmataceae bacterium]|nr:Stealth CR1 domain-containing protein [Mycoplasmataceae bacterium]
MGQYDFPVDLVYLWCDGSDQSFFKRKNACINKNKFKDSSDVLTEENGLNHIMQMDELKYSLRGVDKYLPWINHIYIIVDGQIPPFINLDNPKISLVDVKELAFKNEKDLFNTNAIEALIYKIKGLSEHFLRASDDYFVNKSLDKSYFFTAEGKPIVYLKKYSGIKHHFHLQVFNAYAEIFKEYNPKNYWGITHCMDPNVISDFKSMENSQWKNLLFYTQTSPLRSNYNLQHLFANLYSYRNGNTIIHKLSKHESLSMNAYTTSKSLWKIKKFNPNLYAINARAKDTNKDKAKVKAFLDKKYPDISQYEK